MKEILRTVSYVRKNRSISWFRTVTRGTDAAEQITRKRKVALQQQKSLCMFRQL
jgi:hypothetical protein